MILFINIIFIIIFYFNPISGTSCCLDSNCVKMKNCSAGHSHCIVVGKFEKNFTVTKYVNLSDIILSHFDCWTWPQEVHFCPKIRNTCYSAHNHLFAKTFCCAGEFCNKPSLSCEIKENLNGNSNITFPTLAPPRQKQSENHNIFYVLLVILTIILIIVIVIAKLYCKKWRVRRKSHNTFNGVSCNSDRNTCLSKITNDGFSESALSTIMEEVNKASLVYEKCEKKCVGKFGEIWTGKLLQLEPLTSSAEVPGTAPASYQQPGTTVQCVAVKIFGPSNEPSWEVELEMYRHIRNRCVRILRYVGWDKIMDGGVVRELWLVTEYMPCGSLHDRLTSCSRASAGAACSGESAESRPRWSDVLRFCVDLAGGLSYLHEDGTYPQHQNNGTAGKPSIAHRDLKSRNILVRPDWSACIADLGLAVSFHGNRSLNDLHLQVGTMRYMSPEVLEGAISFSRDAFLAIDIYAMALIMWEIFGQCTDFEGLNASPSLDPPPAYQQPFELDLGSQISIERLQGWVVNRGMRPDFPGQYRGFELGTSLWKTIVECWDRDAEARLSSSCVFERLMSLTSRSNMPVAPHTSQSRDPEQPVSLVRSLPPLDNQPLLPDRV